MFVRKHKFTTGLCVRKAANCAVGWKPCVHVAAEVQCKLVCGLETASASQCMPKKSNIKTSTKIGNVCREPKRKTNEYVLRLVSEQTGREVNPLRQITYVPQLTDGYPKQGSEQLPYFLPIGMLGETLRTDKPSMYDDTDKERTARLYQTGLARDYYKLSKCRPTDASATTARRKLCGQFVYETIDYIGIYGI